jgi:hypothetical protein
VKLTHEWDHDGYPHDTAIVQLDTICPTSPGIKSPGGGQPPWTVTCDPPWTIGIPLYVTGQITGQGQQTLVAVYKTLEAAKAGGGNYLARYNTPALGDDDLAAPYDLTLNQHGTVEPDLFGYHVVILPGENPQTPLWSVYSTPGFVQGGAPELTLCGQVVAILQNRTGAGDALEGVESENIWCGPTVPEKARIVPSIAVEVKEPQRSADFANGADRHLECEFVVAVQVHKNAPEVAWRYCRTLAARVEAILQETKPAVAFRVTPSPVNAEPPQPVEGDVLTYRSLVGFRADLLGE